MVRRCLVPRASSGFAALVCIDAPSLYDVHTDVFCRYGKYCHQREFREEGGRCVGCRSTLKNGARDCPEQTQDAEWNARFF